MELILVAAALLSAFLHAAWNAAVKAQPDTAGAMTAQIVMAAALAVPGLIWAGLPPLAAWPWIAGSTVMNLATVLALLRAYDRIGFGFAYPVGRAFAVLMVAPMAALVTGVVPTLAGLAGIVMIAGALSVLALENRQQARLADSRSKGGLFWTLVSGAAAAAYAICDAQGVRATGSPFSYGFTLAITNALAFALRQRRNGPLLPHFKTYWRLAIPASLAAMASYLLILYVFAKAPIAPAAALRDTSALFAVIIAVFVLKERFSKVRVAAILIAASAIPLLRLA